MEGFSWVLYANMAVWLGVGGYMLFLSRKLTGLEKRLSRMAYAAKRREEGTGALPEPSANGPASASANSTGGTL